MNELTKEDLIDILEYCSAWKPPGLGMSNARMEAWRKLDAMIDNYCLHKNNVWPLYTATGDIPIAGFFYECNLPIDKKYINE